MLEVGRIAKPHGIRGEVIVELFTDRIERVAPGTVLSSSKGELRIERSSSHLGRWIVAFEGILDRTGAEALRGVVLSAEPIEDPDTLWVHELIGAEVVDVTGRSRGRVTAVEANPASDILVLEDDQLVPLRFVVEHTAGRLVIDPPEGLLS